jgi:hypothetical protein
MRIVFALCLAIGIRAEKCDEDCEAQKTRVTMLQVAAKNNLTVGCVDKGVYCANKWHPENPCCPGLSCDGNGMGDADNNWHCYDPNQKCQEPGEGCEKDGDCCDDQSCTPIGICSGVCSNAKDYCGTTSAVVHNCCEGLVCDGNGPDDVWNGWHCYAPSTPTPPPTPKPPVNYDITLVSYLPEWWHWSVHGCNPWETVPYEDSDEILYSFVMLQPSSVEQFEEFKKQYRVAFGKEEDPNECGNELTGKYAGPCTTYDVGSFFEEDRGPTGSGQASPGAIRTFDAWAALDMTGGLVQLLTDKKKIHWNKDRSEHWRMVIEQLVFRHFQRSRFEENIRGYLL